MPKARTYPRQEFYVNVGFRKYLVCIHPTTMDSLSEPYDGMPAHLQLGADQLTDMQLITHKTGEEICVYPDRGSGKP